LVLKLVFVHIVDFKGTEHRDNEKCYNVSVISFNDVVDTGEDYFSGVVDTGMVILTGVNATAVVVVKIGCFILVSLTPVRYYYTGVVDTGEYY